MRMPAPNPNAFARCPDCGALVSARITSPACPKTKPPFRGKPASVDAVAALLAFEAAFTTPAPRQPGSSGITMVVDPPNLPALARGGRIPLPIDDTPARRRSNRRIR